MRFQTASATPRPVRLAPATRQWAWNSLHGLYGDDAARTPCVSLDEIDGFSSMPPLAQYDAAIRQIARQAPIRICPEERISGAATLGAAIDYAVPAAYRGACLFPGVNHLTIRYDRVLKEGLEAYKRDITARLALAADGQETAFLRSLDNVVEALRVWHARYLDAVREEKPAVYRVLQRVPFAPARNFLEAVQALWFIFAFVRLCGNWPGIGRIDWLLGDYLQKDLAAGVLTKPEAREILASFFIKGCEWIQSQPRPGSGDAQHYQNIVLAGIDAAGREVTNDVTYLVLDIVEELAIADFPITVRLNSRSPERLLRKTAQVMRHGGGIVAVYNEDLILRALKNEGYPESEARTFANDGCWEIQIPGKTDFAYMPFDALQVFNRVLGVDSDGPVPAYPSAESLYQAFLEELKQTVEQLYQSHVRDVFCCTNGRWRRREAASPSSVVSLFEDGCIENTAPYFALGPVYTVRSPHIGGAPDVANSLYALQKAVFEEKRLSLRDMVTLLRGNWEGAEALRLYMKTHYVYYGNDSDEADAWHTRLLDDFAAIVGRCGGGEGCPVKFIPGVSTFGRQIAWLPNRSATAFGCRRGDILAGNDSPTPGTDSAGATAIIRSYCKADLEKQSCGAALDIRIFPDTLRGENGIAALKALLRGFVQLNGCFMQLDTVDAQTLREAQRDPETYKTLSVRVSGWNARFITLEKEWQSMIIERTAQGL